MSRTISKESAPQMNRAQRRQAYRGRVKLATMPKKKAYALLYYNFRGKWKQALNKLTKMGLTRTGLKADGKQYWGVPEHGQQDMLPVPKGHREPFLNDPAVWLRLWRMLDMDTYRPRRTKKRKARP